MIAHLQKNGYIVVFKLTLRMLCGVVKGNIDAELVKDFSNARLSQTSILPRRFKCLYMT